MAIKKSDIADRINILKNWQKDNLEKMDSNSFIEGYNSSVNSEILFLEELLTENSVAAVSNIAKKPSK
jgi:hypothetical protein